MKKIFLLFVVLSTFTNLSYADTYVRANADQYTLTIQSIKLCENATINSETSFSTSDCITLGNSSLTVDIASASVGATLGKYADTTALVAGKTYRYFVPTMSRTFTIKGGAVVDSRISGTFSCNTDEDATIAGNARNLTQRAGQVGGTATAATVFVPSATSSGKMCLVQNCSSTSDNQTFTHDLPDDTTLYGNAASVPTDNSDNMSMIYTIATPFTMKDIPPVINMNFGTRNALEVESMNNGGSDACRVSPFFPKFKVTVTLPN
jgi:hypothetical protein